jgi:hypothetical protein
MKALFIIVLFAFGTSLSYGANGVKQLGFNFAKNNSSHCDLEGERILKFFNEQGIKILDSKSGYSSDYSQCRFDMTYYSDLEFRFEAFTYKFFSSARDCSSQLPAFRSRFEKLYGAQPDFDFCERESKDKDEAVTLNLVKFTKVKKGEAYSELTYSPQTVSEFNAILAQLADQGITDVFQSTAYFAGIWHYQIYAMIEKDQKAPISTYLQLGNILPGEPNFSVYDDLPMCKNQLADIIHFAQIAYEVKNAAGYCTRTAGINEHSWYGPTILLLSDKEVSASSWNAENVPFIGSCMDSREKVKKFYSEELKKDVGLVLCSSGYHKYENHMTVMWR